MSAYYHTAMREVFVGILFAVGAYLYLYKGFSAVENIALNLAGTFAICIPLFPTPLPGAAGLIARYAHGTSALLSPLR